MASDGSQPLVTPPERAAAAAVGQAPAARPRAATGVWDGPAPTGWRTPAAEAAPPSSAPFDAAKEPRTTLLANGVRLPLLGVAAADAAGVACAPRDRRRTRARTRTRARLSHCARAR
jgi:hypothetical protein